MLAYCGFFQQDSEPIKAVDGAANLVLDELRQQGLRCDPFFSPTTSNWIILLEPEAVKLALDRVLAAHGVDVLLHTRVAAVTRTADRTETVTLAAIDGRTRVTAEAFVNQRAMRTSRPLPVFPAALAARQANSKRSLRQFELESVTNLCPPTERLSKLRFKTTKVTGHSARDDGGINTEVSNTGEQWWMMFDHPMQDLSSASLFTSGTCVGDFQFSRRFYACIFRGPIQLTPLSSSLVADEPRSRRALACPNCPTNLNSFDATHRSFYELKSVDRLVTKIQFSLHLRER